MNYQVENQWQMPQAMMNNGTSEQEIMAENSNVDFKDAAFIKEFLAIVIYKSIVFTFLLLLLMIIIPSINPEYT
jgi:hypothetical protein